MNVQLITLILSSTLALAVQGGACRTKRMNDNSQTPSQTKQMNDNSQTPSKNDARDAAPRDAADAQRADTSPDDKRLATGLWGGQQVMLEVSDADARIEFACAHGVLEGPLVLSDGRFEVKGTFVSEGGPVRHDDEERRATPARYVGRIEGDTLTLTIRYESSDKEIGAYKLKHGQAVRLFKCK